MVSWRQSQISDHTEIIMSLIDILDTRIFELCSSKQDKNGNKFKQLIREYLEFKLDNLSDEDLKNRSLDVTESIITTYEKFLIHDSEEGKIELEKVNEIIHEKRFDLQVQYLHSPYIEKKLNAIDGFKVLCSQKIKFKPKPKEEYEFFTKKVLENNILEYIFLKAKHPQLITRATNLLKNIQANGFLLDTQLKLLWKSFEHANIQSVRNASLEVISQISHDISDEQINLLLSLINEVDI